jgi:hypothetical protein
MVDVRHTARLFRFLVGLPVGRRFRAPARRSAMAPPGFERKGTMLLRFRFPANLP